MTTDIQDAMKVMHGVDASRRVGWAKAFAELEKNESLSRDINVITSERDIMRKALSFMYGFTYEYATRCTGGVTAETLNSLLGEFEVILDSNVRRAGHESARKCIAQEPPKRLEHKAKMSNRSDKWYQDMIKKAYCLIAKRYGFKDWRGMKDAMDVYLGQEESHRIKANDEDLFKALREYNQRARLKESCQEDSA